MDETAFGILNKLSEEYSVVIEITMWKIFLPLPPKH